MNNLYNQGDKVFVFYQSSIAVKEITKVTPKFAFIGTEKISRIIGDDKQVFSINNEGANQRYKDYLDFCKLSNTINYIENLIKDLEKKYRDSTFTPLDKKTVKNRKDIDFCENLLKLLKHNE